MKFKYNFLLLAVALSMAIPSAGQELTQKVTGRVIDRFTGIPLANTSVIVSNGARTFNAQSDAKGVFQIDVPIGRYKITSSLTGYSPVEQELLVVSGRETVVNFTLAEKVEMLKEVEVIGTSEEENVPGLQSLTIEKTLRVPANFFDPVRIATAYPGVIAANDQSNSIIVKGNSPSGLLWRLNGLDIVNPNHLANAGTLSDKPASNGGGVNILSAQMLDRTNFYTGAFPARYGNAMAGIIDMKLREGNKNKFQYTAQASLIGMDIAAEGPLGKKQNTSFVANYRYSTVGLLSKMGVNFGDEAITFQDLSFFLDKDLAKGGKLSWFAIYGNSVNEFKHKIAADWKEDKDKYDIDYTSKTLATGINYTKPMLTSGKFSIGLAYSNSNQKRDQIAGPEMPGDFSFIAKDHFSNDYSIMSALIKLESKAGQNSNWEAGIMANVQSTQLDYDLVFQVNGPSVGFIPGGSGTVEGLLLQPFVNWQTTFSKTFSLQAGLHYLNFTYNNRGQLEPRVQLTINSSPASHFDLSYNLVSQVQPSNIYIANPDADLTKAHHLNLNYTNRVSESLNVKTGIFYQQLYDVPVLNPTASVSTFSSLNLVENDVFAPMANIGKGTNYGIDGTVEKNFYGNQYFMLGASFYESKYKDNAGREFNTRFNGKYTLSSVYGKEWTKLSRNRTIGLNARMLYLGGMRESTVDAAKSQAYGFSAYDNSNPYNQKLNDYFRLDMRLSFRKNKPRYTRTLAIDIQNLTSQQNEAYHYYDFTQQKIVTKFQLGIIPILVYRIDF